MPIYKDEKRGTWYVSFTYKDKDGKFRTRKKRGFKTKAEAKQWEHDNFVSESAPVVTFQDAVDSYERFAQTTKDTRRKHKEHFEARFSEFLDKPIDEITTKDLVDWRGRLLDMPYATSTKNTTIGLVKSVFSYHCNVYSIKNPSYILKTFKKKKEEIMQEMQTWTPEQFDIFIAHVKEPEYKVFFSFLFWTGCRRGEAVALQIKDVKNGYATIKYSQTNQKDGLKPTKTKQPRTIQLDDVLWEDIQPLLEKDTPYVFGKSKGFAIKSIERRWAKAKKASGLPNIRIHDLRHSHATWLINSGVNIVAVSKRLGHADVNQTLKTYTHLMETTDQAMMAKINAKRGMNRGMNRGMKNKKE